MKIIIILIIIFIIMQVILTLTFMGMKHKHRIAIKHWQMVLKHQMELKDDVVGAVNKITNNGATKE